MTRFQLALLTAISVLAGFKEDHLRPTWAAERPNILFCIADDASFPHMGAYGCTWVETPAFDRVAREGLLFTRAYTPNAKCAPSRACILTGRNSWQLKAACNHIPYFPNEFKTYAEALSEHGYFVGMTAKGWAPGVAIDARGNPRRHMAGAPFNKRTTSPPARAISNNDYAGNFEEFLQTAPPKKPWCFWYGCFEPHRAYEYGAGISKGFKSVRDIDRVPGFWPDNEVIRTDMLDYAFEIEYFDHHLARMLSALEERGELDNTLVVVTSDNGMPFPRVKGQEYEMSNHLPLAIMWKQGISNPGRVIEDYVSFIDFAPTFLDVADVQWERSGMPPATGTTLVNIFRSPKSGQVDPTRDHVLIGKERHDIGRPHDWGYPIRGIVKNGMLFIRNFETDRWPAGNPETGYLNCDGSPTKTEILNLRRSGNEDKYWHWSFGKRKADELYNVQEDPDCLDNLAGTPKYQEIETRFREQLLRELRAQEDPRAMGQGDIFDTYPYANKGQRGFYEKFTSGVQLRAGWVNASDFEQAPIEQ
jgi:N-sulfoglucosamine sulfohydrolase